MEDTQTMNIIVMMFGLVLNTVVIVIGVTKVALKFTERLSIIETQVKHIMDDLKDVKETIHSKDI